MVRSNIGSSSCQNHYQPKFYSCRSAMQLYWNPYGSPPVNLLHICRTAMQLYWNPSGSPPIFEEKLWGTTSKNNSFAQVSCKFCLHKLKWTNLILQSLSNIYWSAIYKFMTAGQQNVLRRCNSSNNTSQKKTSDASPYKMFMR